MSQKILQGFIKIDKTRTWFWNKAAVGSFAEAYKSTKLRFE